MRRWLLPLAAGLVVGSLFSGFALADPPENIFDFSKPTTKPAEPDSHVTASPPPVVASQPVAPAPEPVNIAPPKAPAKTSVPDAVSLAKAMAMIDEVHGSDFVAAKTEEQKRAFAEKLIQEGIDEQVDTSAKYALFKRASDLASSVGDLSTVGKAIEQADNTFAINPSQWLVDAAVTASKSPGVAPSDFAATTDRLAGEAAAKDDYKTAKQLEDLAVAAAHQTKNTQLVARIDKRSEMLADTSSGYDLARPAFEILKLKPDDKNANLAVGRFYCFYKDKWDAGLPLLAAGSDSSLSALAVTETSDKSPATELGAAADRWWTIADQQTPAVRQRIRLHAGVLYRRAAPTLVGLAKIKAEKRVAELSQSAPASDITSAILQPFRADATEYHWEKDQAALSLMPANAGFCVLSRITGHFEGNGECASVIVSNDGGWTSDCGSHQDRLIATFIGYKTKPDHAYPSNATIVEWSLGQPKVRVISRDQGICFLSGVRGHFVGAGENVGLTYEKDGYWYLGGTSGQNQLGASAVAIPFPDTKRVAIDGRAFSWRAGNKPIKLIADGKGICGLIGFSGRLGPEGDEAGLRLDADGFWYLDGKANYKELSVKAAVYKYPAE